MSDHLVTFGADRDGGRGRFVAVTGNIGSGKTWLCEALAIAALGPKALFYETVDAVAFRRHLGAFNTELRSGETRGAGFQMQVFVLHTRLRDHRAATALRDLGWMVVQDQPIYGDPVFAANAVAAGSMTRDQYEDYRGLVDTVAWEIQPPDVVIYCETPVAECVANIRGRGRPEEVGTPVRYLEGLGRGFDSMVGRLESRGVRVLRVPWDGRAGASPSEVGRGLWRTVGDRFPSISPQPEPEEVVAEAGGRPAP